MNNLAQFDGGVFLRYLFIPAQVIIAVTQNLIPNLKLIPGINKFTFPLIFVFLFFTFYGATFTNKIGGVSGIRENRRDGSWEGWEGFVTYYAWIPISYFVIVGIIIIGAFILDAVKQLGDGSYFKDGLIAAVAKFLFAIISISMSIVLSGFSAIPLGLFAVYWLVFPEGKGWPSGKYEGWKNWHNNNAFDYVGFTKWSNAIRDNYWLPEWDVCEETEWIKWARYITRKLWNNKILISFFIVTDIALKLGYGKGNLLEGKYLLDDEPWYVHAIRLGFPIILLSFMMGQPATRERGILRYFKSFFEHWGIIGGNKDQQPTTINSSNQQTATNNPIQVPP